MLVLGHRNYIINQSICIAPLQELYSEALPTLAWSKRKVLRCLEKEQNETEGRERIVDGRSFQTDGPTTEKALLCIVAVLAKGMRISPRAEESKERLTRVTDVSTKSSHKKVEAKSSST